MLGCWLEYEIKFTWFSFFCKPIAFISNNISINEILTCVDLPILTFEVSFVVRFWASAAIIASNSASSNDLLTFKIKFRYFWSTSAFKYFSSIRITYYVSHLYANMKSPVQPLPNHLQLQLPHLLTQLLLSLKKKWPNQGRQEVVVILDDHLQMIPKMIRNNIVIGK